MEMIDNYLGKHFAGEASEEENLIVQKWAEENQEVYLQLRLLLENNINDAVHHELHNYNDEVSWKKIEPRLSNYKNNRIAYIKRFYNPTWISAAASLIVAFAAVAWFFLRTIEVTTGKGTIREIALSDGSKVVLGEESSLKYKYLFSANRKIKLEGRGFFDVAKDKQNPFEVVCSDFNVTVLGTSFQVTNTNLMQEVTVNTGSVAIQKGNQATVLKPNERIILTNELFEKESINTNNNSAWLTKKLTFQNNTLTEVFKDLENYFQIDIQIPEGSNLNCQLTSSYQDQTLTEILKELKSIFNFNYQIDGQIIKISDLICN